MDILSLLGFVVAVGAVLGGQWIEGGHIASLVQATAFVIVIGGTLGAVMLQSRLPVPVINPGPLSYKMAESALALGYSHSRQAYPRPMHPRLDMLEAMQLAAQQSIAGVPRP